MTSKGRVKKPSPLLGIAAGLVEDAGIDFVSGNSKFHHSFEVSLEQIEADPGQPRKDFDEDALLQLSNTMESDGQLQPILLRKKDRPGSIKKWIIVAGERRWRAAQLAKWKTILAIEYNGDPEVAALVENLQRVDLNPKERAIGIEKLITQKGWTQIEAAEALGKSAVEISAILKILTLPDKIVDDLVKNHSVTQNALVELSRIADPATRDELVNEARQGKLTVKAIRERRDPSSGSSKVNFNFVSKLARQIGNMREHRIPISDEHQSHLRALRDEIDSLIAASEKD